MQESLILDIFYYFCATVICVPIFKAMGLGSIFGYLVSGALLGPHGFSLLHNVENIQEISQIGMIMLLFVIGLELTPARLRHLRSMILGVGILQFVLTTGVLYFALGPFALGEVARLLIASSLSLSSTAFALTFLRESEHLTKSYGQSSFGVLIFQDLIIIPLMTAIPFLANNANGSQLDWGTFLMNLGFLAFCLIIGKLALRTALHKIYHTQGKDIFMCTCFVLILGSAIFMDQMGLSKALGAFMAGLFLSGSDFRSEIQSFSIPLKSMLIGVFFMGFGLEFNLTFFRENYLEVLLSAGAFMGVKFIILLAIGRVAHKDWRSGLKLGLILCQGGEFGFLILSASLSQKIISFEVGQFCLSVLTVSIFMAPFLTKLLEWISPTNSTTVAEIEDSSTSNVEVLPLVEREEKKAA